MPWPQNSFPIQYVTSCFPNTSSTNAATLPTTRPPARTVRIVIRGSPRILAQCALNALRSAGSLCVNAAMRTASGSRCCSKKIGRSLSSTSRSRTSIVIRSSYLQVGYLAGLLRRSHGSSLKQHECTEQVFYGPLDSRRSIHGRPDAEGEGLGAFIRGRGPRNVEGGVGSLPIRSRPRALHLRHRHSSALSERLVARRGGHGVFDDRHDCAVPAHARQCRPLPIRTRPEWNQHRANGREEARKAAPPV